MDWSLDFGTRGKLKTGLIRVGWLLTTLLLWCQAALAGQYSVTYSGGVNGVTISPTGYSTWQQNYALVNGWFEGYQWCYTTIPGDPPTNLACAGTVTCDGTITATFTWGGGGTPPDSVVVKEECTAVYAGSTGSVDTTLTVVASTSTSETGERYRTVVDPGQSFQLTCAPTATGSRTTAVPQTSAKVSYRAKVADIYVESMEFTNCLDVLTDWNTNYASDSGNTYSFNGWKLDDEGGTTVPIHFVVDTTPTVDMVYGWSPTGRTYDLNWFSLEQIRCTGLTASGVGLEASATALAALDTVGRFTYAGTENWTASTSSGTPSLSGSMKIEPVNELFVTWDEPKDGSRTPTLKRMRWACTKIHGTANQKASADAIWNAIPGETTFYLDPSAPDLLEGANWELLDVDGYGANLYSGQCDELADLMTQALLTVGVFAETINLRASTDDSDYTNLETQIDGGYTWYLMMDFDLSSGFAPNWFEGCCSTCNHWYAIEPHDDASSAYGLWRALPFQQFWARVDGTTWIIGSEFQKH